MLIQVYTFHSDSELFSRWFSVEALMLAKCQNYFARLPNCSTEYSSSTEYQNSINESENSGLWSQMQGFSFNFQRQSGFTPLEFCQWALTKEIFRYFFSYFFSKQSPTQRDKGMQNHLADSTASGCYINLIIQTHVMQ